MPFIPSQILLLLNAPSHPLSDLWQTCCAFKLVFFFWHVHRFQFDYRDLAAFKYWDALGRQPYHSLSLNCLVFNASKSPQLQGLGEEKKLFCLKILEFSNPQWILRFHCLPNPVFFRCARRRPKRTADSS